MTDRIDAARRMMAGRTDSKTREFFEFVLPPVDMRLEQEGLVVLADMPGFEKGDIRVSLEGDILRIRASKGDAHGAGGPDAGDGGDGGNRDADGTICCQRPNIIDKKFTLPVSPLSSKGDDGNGNTGEPAYSARYADGILRIVIPINVQ